MESFAINKANSDLTKIWGVGPVTAKKLMEKGIMNISDVRKVIEDTAKADAAAVEGDAGIGVNMNIGGGSGIAEPEQPLPLPLPRHIFTHQQKVGARHYEDFQVRDYVNM